MDPDYIATKRKTSVWHHARLSDDGHNVPAGEIIAAITSDSTDPISLQFLIRLRAAAGMIGEHTDVVRAEVDQNATALKQAADDLTNLDETGGQDFTQVAAIVDATAADTSQKDVDDAEQTKQEAGAGGAPTTSNADTGSGSST